MNRSSMIAGIALLALAASLSSASANDVPFGEEELTGVTSDPVSYCQFLSHQSMDIATYRDAGDTKRELRSYYAGAIGVDWVVQDIFAAIDMAYTYPRLSPMDEAELIYLKCREVYNQETLSF